MSVNLCFIALFAFCSVLLNVDDWTECSEMLPAGSCMHHNRWSAECHCQGNGLLLVTERSGANIHTHTFMVISDRQH